MKYIDTVKAAVILSPSLRPQDFSMVAIVRLGARDYVATDDDGTIRWGDSGSIEFFADPAAIDDIIASLQHLRATLDATRERMEGCGLLVNADDDSTDQGGTDAD